MCAERKPTNHATQAGAKQGYQPTHHAASASAAQFTTTRRLAERAANRPTAHGNTPTERRACRTYVRWARGPWVT